MGLKKVEAIINPSDVTAVERELDSLGIDSVSLTKIITHQSNRSLKIVYRGTEYRTDIQRVKVEFFVTDQLVDDAIGSITRITGALSADGGSISLFDVADRSLLKGWQTD